MILVITFANRQGAGGMGQVCLARASSWDLGSMFRDRTHKGTRSVSRGLELVPTTNRG